MSALPITITTAGLQALINAQNTGVSNVVIAQIGVSAIQTNITAATTAIANETKRLGAVAGQVTAEDTFYVSVADQSADTYAVRTIGLYLSNGVLFGGYSQTAPLVEKAAPSMVVLEAAIKLASPLAAGLQFTGGGWRNPPASETVEGVLRLATEAEAAAGVNHSRAVTPKGLKGVMTTFAASVQAAFDDIDKALAGKSPTGHKHDAADTTTGVFNVARIPALAMEKITGLAAALAAKANLVGAVFSGYVEFRSRTATAGGDVIALVPTDYGPGKPGMFFSQAGLKWQIALWDGKANVGSLNVAAVDLSVSGSRVWHADNFDPATKSNTGHKHDAADTTTGVFNVGCIPALAMEKITGLAAALAAKASLAGSAFSGYVEFRSRTAVGGGDVIALLPTDHGPGKPGMFFSQAGLKWQISLWDGQASTGSLDVAAVDLSVSGSRVWHAGNFDPATKSNTGHKHDAADTTTGVFNVGRIPALAMEKITGLAAALAAKASLAGSVFSGYVEFRSRPAAAGGDVMALAPTDYGPGKPGLFFSQNGLKWQIALWDSQAMTGSLDVAAVDLSVSGSRVWHAGNFDPATKSNTGHKHDAGDTTTGVFDLGRIPAVGMEKVTGLANALDARAPKASPVFSGSVRSSGNNFELPGEGSYFGFNLYYSGAWRYRTASHGWYIRHGGASFEVAYAASGAADAVATILPRLRIDGATGKAYLGPSEIWSAANFDPATKANASHTHDWSHVTGKDDVVLKSDTGLGRIGGGPLTTLSSPQQYGALPTGWTSMVHPASGGLPLATYGYLSKLARRDSGDGWAGLMVTHAANAGDKVEVYAGATPSGDAYAAWSRFWTDTNDDRVGSIMLFGCDYAPAGYLKCNGAEVSRATYAALFARIGTRHGGGNGSTTFNLPDLRGEFLRGWDDGRGVDGGRALGSGQGQDIQSHSHQTVVGQAPGGGSSGLYSSGDDYTGTIRSYVDTLASGGAETRPRNVAFLACIKF